MGIKGDNMKKITKKIINNLIPRFVVEILLVLGYITIIGLYYYMASILIG